MACVPALPTTALHELLERAAHIQHLIVSGWSLATQCRLVVHCACVQIPTG